MIKSLLIGIVVLLAIFCIVVASRPDEFRISRSISIAAPAAVIFPHVNNLHLWQQWSPWAKLDPAAKYTYSGTDSGIGASFAWAGNSNVGEGRMTIVESQPNELVRFKLEFEKPFKGTNAAEFTFKPEGNQTLVTWSMSGKNNFITKAVGLFMNCDKMVGLQFENGLADLKVLSEGQAK